MKRLTERVRFTIRADRKADLKRVAALEGITLSELILRIIVQDIPELKDTP